MSGKSQDWFTGIFGEFNPEKWVGRWEHGPGHRRRGKRGQMFESGEMKYIILTLIKEQPRHGYDIIKALEERTAGCYSPSAGTVYPTLQLLEDQGYIRGLEKDGRKVYQITPEGEAFLEEHRDLVQDILERVRDTLRNVAGGSMGRLNEAVAGLVGVTYRAAWQRGQDAPQTESIIKILTRATDEIRAMRTT